MKQYNTNPLADYGFATEISFINYRKQLKNQDMDTEFFDEFPKGFKPGSPEPTPSAKDRFLTFTSNQDNTVLGFYQIIEGGKYPPPFSYNIQYKKDTDEDWIDYTVGEYDDTIIPIMLNEGESVKFKGVNPNGLTFNDDGCYYNFRFGLTGNVSASGDITSLINGVGGDCPLPALCCERLFYHCEGLTTAPNLPSTTLAEDCYSGMFQGCTGLTTAPELPATTLAFECYAGMFQGCTGLTTAPELPATTLAELCYSYMFQGCEGLTAAPALPATTLASQCYAGMFQDCMGLTTAPALPATTLVDSCYGYMFSGCSSLSSITCLATDITASSCTDSWVNVVSKSGTFTKAASMSDWTEGISGIPSGWAVVDYGGTSTEINDSNSSPINNDDNENTGPIK